MVDWSRLFSSRTPSVGTPGMHMNATPQPTYTQPTPLAQPKAQENPKKEEPIATTQTPQKKEPEPTPAPPPQPDYFFTPRQTPLSPEELAAGKEAHRIRLANVTSSFEAPINPKTQMPDRRTPTANERATGADVPLLMPAKRFYKCKGDAHPGLTVGYGTFFIKKGIRGRLIKEDKALLPSLTILNQKTGQTLMDDTLKETTIQSLFSHINKPATLQAQPFIISNSSADALLRERFNEKTNDLDRLLSNKGKRTVAPRSALTDWVASDLYYQGALSSKTGIPDFAKDTINKSRLPAPNPENLRLTARRTSADLQRIIRENPFTPTMSESERQKHAQHLAEYCTAYAAHQMTRANPEFYYTRTHVQAHIQDLSSLATMDIARSYYGRELSAQEIRQCTEKSAQIAGHIFSAEKPAVYAMRLSLANESLVKNSLGHYRAKEPILSAAKKQEEPKEAQPPTSETKGPNLTASLRNSSTQTPLGESAHMPQIESNNRTS